MTFLATANKIVSLNGFLPIQLTRLAKYSISGGMTMLIDFAILIWLVEKIGVHYIAAAIIGFLIAHTVHYTINRSWAFKDAPTKIMAGYTYFILFGVATSILVGVFMAILVEYFGLYYIVAKIIVLVTLGIFNFVLNYTITFGMGEEIKRLFIKIN